MESATKTNRTLEISGMTGDECITKVSTALKGVSAVTTHAVKVGSAHIGADAAGCSAACASIEGAGFTARERMGQNGSAPAPAESKPAAAPAAAYSVADASKAPVLNSTDPKAPAAESQAVATGPTA